MTVSVLMPMRNAQAYLVEAMTSVLQERSVPLELVVVDDGSTDDSRRLALAIALEDTRVRVIDGPRSGIAACMNTALAAAVGEVVMRCDADDIYPVGRIALQLAWLQEHPDHVAVCGPFNTIDMRGRLVARLWDERTADCDDISQELRAGITRTHLCTYGIRRDALARLGGFRAYFETAEDIDLALRLGDSGAVGFDGRVAYLYRLHETSVTHTQREERRVFFENVARQFCAQRKQSGSDALMEGSAPEPPTGDGSPPSSAAHQIQGMLIGQAWRALDRNERQAAVRCAVQAIRARPFDVNPWLQALKVCVRCAVPARAPRA